MSKDDSFIIRTKYRPALMDLTPEQQGNILMACIDYVLYGYAKVLEDPAANMLLRVIIQDIQADKEKYDEICEKRRKSAIKRHDANAYKSIQKHTSDANAYKSYRYDNDSDSDNDNMNDIIGSPVSLSPSISAVDRKNELKKQISDLNKITLKRIGGVS